MVSHGSLSDSKSPQVSSTLLNILTEWSPLVFLFPSRPVIVPIFSDCTKIINYYWYNDQFHVPQFFSIPSQGLGIYPSFRFLSILLFSQPGQQSPQFGKFTFFVDHFKV